MAAIDPSIIDELTITALGGGKSFNLAQVTVTFKYEEDLFSPMVTAQVLVANTGVGDKQAIYHALPIRGGESVSIKIPANSDNNRDLEFTGENVLYVSSITNVLIGPTREIFTLNLVSQIFECVFEVFGRARTYRNLFGCVLMHSDASGCVQMHLDTF